MRVTVQRKLNFGTLGGRCGIGDSCGGGNNNNIGGCSSWVWGTRIVVLWLK